MPDSLFSSARRELLQRIPLIAALIAAFAWLVATAPPTLAQHYNPERGSFKTESDDLVLTAADVPARGESSRDIPIKVRFPIGANGALPLVVFSHGMGGSSAAFPEFSDHLASHGYVVILPTHSDSVKLRREKGEDAGREILGNPAAYVRNVKPMERVDDIKRILDAIPTIEQKIFADAKATISREAITMAGHSAGAMTTQMVFGVKVRTRVLGGVQSVADPRIKAAIVISGQGLKTRLFTKDSWSDLDKPMLVITGSEDTAKAGNDTPESRRHPFEYAPASQGEPHTYLLWIEGATHGSYQSKSAATLLGEKPGDPAMVAAATSSATLAFLDAYVKFAPDSDEATAAQRYLAGDAIAAATNNKATLKRK
jgi:predicted dienelactone hydrolase